MTDCSGLTVLAAGALTTLQDRGRLGLAHLGVPRAGPLDDRSADLANRLLGNPAEAAVLEVTLGQFAARAGSGHWVAVTGAPCPVVVDDAPAAHAEAVWVPAGAVLRLGKPVSGVRSYVAVAGGFDVEPVLGSRATDTLAWVGPPRVGEGTDLPVGRPAGEPHAHDTPRPGRRGPLRVTPGPRDDWFGPNAVDRLCAAPYVVEADSNRVGLRLKGSALEWRREDELPSEGMVLGAVQVPPNGQPVVFLADHPPTGGYPVVGVVRREDLWQCGQLRPGDEVRFMPDHWGDPRRVATP
jgi:biotin-dependent carboxylase-like uncharacterized protein